ncbi:MAG TPA: hypothetical protein VGS08_02870 [Candidatus Saccharimonadales bacterium]|nr:hypothetical protein [Candidatus Saccharimonadales bacterium]
MLLSTDLPQCVDHTDTFDLVMFAGVLPVYQLYLVTPTFVDNDIVKGQA